MNTPTEPAVTERSEQAAEWCRCIAEGSLSPEQERAFEEWVGADERNRRAFDRATFIWRALDGRAAPPQLVEIRLDALGSLRGASRAASVSTRLARWKRPIAAAAGILALALSGTLYLTARTVTYETGVGERRVIVLGDGSRVSLDGASRIEVEYARNRRELDLRAGRAKFDVASDPLRPFSVSVTDKVVVAIGTSFSVERLTRRVEVVLYEGHVSVLRNEQQGDPTTSSALKDSLQPGQAAIFAEGAAPVVMAIDLAQSQSWEAGQLTFDDEPLALAVERMNRYSSVRLEVADTAAHVPISGVFNANDTEAFLDGVSSVFPVRAQRQHDVVVLSSREE